MRSLPSRRYGTGVAQAHRPAGVAILATLGILASLLALTVALVGLIATARSGVAPSRPLAVYGAALLVSLVVLWINWGFWELIRWAWWFNLLLSLLTITGLAAAATLYVPVVTGVLGRLRPGLAAQQLFTGVLVGLIVAITYHLIAVIYMLSVHTLFRIGVKDERPLWERAQRR
ncbi:MAG: hypothetical protein IPO81_25870 [Kouleothrix sp.]|nr:hypothetical protein [Kouleothrix sp.]